MENRNTHQAAQLKPGKRKPVTGVDMLHSLLERIAHLEAQAHSQHTIGPEVIDQIVDQVLERIAQKTRTSMGMRSR